MEEFNKKKNHEREKKIYIYKIFIRTKIYQF